MVLNALALKKEDVKFKIWEYKFRFWTLIGYFPVAIIFQLINCFAIYCTDWTDPVKVKNLLRML